MTAPIPQSVLVLGCWHLGTVFAACMANVGHRVSLWDASESVRESWRTGKSPVFEPGIGEIVAKCWNKNWSWAEDLAGVAREADWIFLAHDTPIDDQDRPNIRVVEESLRALLSSAPLKSTVNVLVTAQVPVGTCRRFQKQIHESFQSRGSEWKGSLIYHPENLRLGSAIPSLLQADRWVLGFDGFQAPTGAQRILEFRRLFSEFSEGAAVSVDAMRLESAEMVKHAMNSFLALSIVFANEMGDLCEKMGADSSEVFASLKRDARVGPKAFLRPGLGFAGGTLARDVRVLSDLRELAPPKNLFSFLYARNDDRNAWVVDKLRAKRGERLSGSKVVLLGVTYKPQTSTVRRSPAIQIAQLLQEQGITCVALDPMADLTELSPTERERLPFQLLTSADSAFEGADAAVLVTEWPEFRELPWSQLISKMNPHALFLDTKEYLRESVASRVSQYCVPGRS